MKDYTFAVAIGFFTSTLQQNTFKIWLSQFHHLPHINSNTQDITNNTWIIRSRKSQSSLLSKSSIQRFFYILIYNWSAEFACVCVCVWISDWSEVSISLFKCRNGQNCVRVWSEKRESVTFNSPAEDTTPHLLFISCVINDCQVCLASPAFTTTVFRAVHRKTHSSCIGL